MRRRILIVLLLLCSSAIPGIAADKWTKVQSKNFTLVGNATENEIREVAEGLEVFRTAFSRFFKQVREGSSVATNVVVFRSDQAFKPFKPLYKGKPANIAGFFQAGEDVNFIALTAEMQTPRVIYHEYVHRLMSDNLANLPPWFQEGSTWEIFFCTSNACRKPKRIWPKQCSLIQSSDQPRLPWAVCSWS